jgi:hypothetical protein
MEYLDNKVIAVPQQLMCTSLIMEMSAEGLYVTDSAHCINKAVLCA